MVYCMSEKTARQSLLYLRLCAEATCVACIEVCSGYFRIASLPQGMMAPPLRPYASPMPAVRTHNNLAAPPLARPTMLLSGPPLGPATPTAYSACHPRWLDCPVTNLAASPIDERRSWP